jgi:choloylglycine hydrolase
MMRYVGFAIVAIVVFAVTFFVTNLAMGCTGVCLQAQDGSIVYARTLEFGADLQSQVLFLPRGYQTIGTTASGSPGLTWKARYAAVGMNAYDHDIFADGVNEQGLAAGIFYFPGYAGYQKVTPQDESQSIAPWELVTWMLTNFATVEEIKAALPSIKVAAVPYGNKNDVPPLHYTARDASGGSLVIEYVDGELHTYDNPIGVITNSPTFDWHQTNLRNYVNLSTVNASPVSIDGVTLAPFGQGSGLVGLPGDFTPPSRFVRAVALSQDALPGEDAEDTVKVAFHVLDSFDIPRGAVRPPAGSNEPLEYTQWTSASDLKNRKYYFHTYDDRRVRSVSLEEFNLDATEPTTFPLNDGGSAIEPLAPVAAN